MKVRRKPDFERGSSAIQNQNQNSPSCILMLIVTVFGYFVFSAISRVLSGVGSDLDQVACYGVIVGLVVLYFLAEREKKQKKLRLYNARQQWKITSMFANVRIVNRHHKPSRTYENGYYPGEYRTSRAYQYFELEMTDIQKAAALDETVVRVDVTIEVYRLMQDRDTVRIYYKPEAPFTFLLEEEI